ncbi:hypothetical protein Btru_032069 [Bulinus truncatus]|nr:hypothetical protein Btru_032069 [Bulinus truncatus]
MTFTFWKLIVILVLCLSQNKSLAGINLDYQTIEDSCTLQMTQGLAYRNVNLGLLRYKQQCKDMEEFISCISRRRQLWDVINIDIPIYDRYFPKIDDLRYAGYIFCKAYLPLLLQLFPPGVDMSACPVPVDECRSKHVLESEVKSLREAVNHKESEKAITLSCRIMAPYSNCIREAYIACSPNYRMLFDYEMAKMGGQCLSAMNLTAPLVAMNRCDPRFSAADSDRGPASGSESFLACITMVASLSHIVFIVNVL